MTMKAWGLAALYILAVVAANLIVNHYGPSSVPYVAFGLVGAALIVRDRFTDFAGPKRLAIQFALIAAGSILTYLLNQDAAKIAVASVTAFATSEGVEALLYLAIYRQPWIQRAPRSAALGAAIDSVLFVSLAFGFTFSLVFLQWVAKLAGAWCWAQLFDLVRSRREVLPRDA